MADDSADALAARLRTALDLCEMGESMRRAQLHREHPGDTDEEIEALLVTWLETRPGAECGDGWGRSISWPPVASLSRAEAALRRIVADLGGLGRRFALVGGLAVSARSEPRLTRDADLAVLVADDRDAEALVRDLQARGWRVIAAIEQDVAGRLATVRLAPVGEGARGAVIDLLFASSGIEPEVVDAADRIEAVPGFTVPVARLGHLIALKVLARDDRTRPQDRVDLAALLTRADGAALGEARESLTLVTRREFHRGRDLLAALEAAVNEFRG